MNRHGISKYWKSTWVKNLALLIILGIATWLGARTLLVPPAVVPASAPEGVFSAQRAMQHLRVIAAEPHPVGTPAQAHVREYIVQQIQSMGLTPSVEPMTGAVPTSLGLFSAYTYNILVRIPAAPGSSSPGVLGVMAHYDSQPNTPAAADDGTAVAGILEAMRAVQAGPGLKNDMIFILTDCEELDGEGVDAFYTQHPWAKEIQAVVNFEAGGTSGATFLTKISAGNLYLADAFRQAVPHPVAYSFLPQLLAVVPGGFGTDMSIFNENGVPGLEPMFGWNYRTIYHSPLDNFDQMDPRTVQQQGENILGLTRYFGNLDLSTLKTDKDAVFFNLLPGVIIQYPTSWAIPLAILAGVLLLLVVVIGLIRHRLTVGGLFAGIGIALVRILLPFVLVAIVWVGIAALHPQFWRNLMGAPYQADVYLLGFIALTASASLALFVLTRRAVSAAHQTLGALVIWFILAMLTSLSLPGMSYLFTWPLLTMTVLVSGWGIWREISGTPQTASPGWAGIARLAVAGIVTMLLIVPFLELLYVLLGFWFVLFNPVLPVIGVIMLFLAIMLTLMTPHMELWTEERKWLTPAITGVLAIGLLVAASVTSGFSAEQPMQTGVWYELNADNGSAYWYSYGQKPEDAWTAQFFQGDIEPVTLAELHPALEMPSQLGGYRGEAPAAALAAPEVKVVSDRIDGEVRILSLHISSLRQARALKVAVTGSIVLGASVNGIRETDPDWAAKDRWFLLYYGLEKAGMDLTLEVRAGQPLQLVVTDQSEGLPEIEGLSYFPRSTDLMPFAMAQEFMPYSDTASVSKTYDIP